MTDVTNNIIKLKARLDSEAKRVLKAQLPKDPAVLREVEENVISIFNRLADSASFCRAVLTPSQTENLKKIYEDAANKVRRVFGRLNLSYIVPDKIGERIEKENVLGPNDTYHFSGSETGSEDQVEGGEIDQTEGSEINQAEGHIDQVLGNPLQLTVSKFFNQDINTQGTSKDSERDQQRLEAQKDRERKERLQKQKEQRQQESARLRDQEIARLREEEEQRNNARMNDVFQWSKLVTDTIRYFDGAEAHLQAFINQCQQVETIMPEDTLANTPIRRYIVGAVKNRIGGSLTNAIKDDDNTIPLIIARIQANVFKQTPNYYEGQLSALVQREGQPTTEFIIELEAKANLIKRAYQLEQGINPRNPNFAESKAVEALRKNLTEKAKDERVRHSMVYGSFLTIEQVLAKVCEYPVGIQNVTVASMYRGNNKRPWQRNRGGYRQQGYPYQGHQHQHQQKQNFRPSTGNRGSSTHGRFNQNQNKFRKRGGHFRKEFKVHTAEAEPCEGSCCVEENPTEQEYDDEPENC